MESNNGTAFAEKEKKKSIFKKEKKEIIKNNKNKNKKEEKKIKKSVIAFDIGCCNIKIVEGSYNRGKLSIDNCITIATPSQAINEGEILVKDAVTTMIGAALRQYNIKSKDAICTTNPTALISREIVVPKVNDDEIETVVRFEIQQYLPINLDDCILQTTILDEFMDELEGKQKFNIRVIVYPKRVALEYYKLLTDLHLRPYTLDVNFNAVNKILNYCGILKTDDDNSGAICTLDMGADFIDVNIYKGNILDFTRRIKFGGNDIDEILIQEAAIDKKRAKEIKYNEIDLVDEKLNMRFENKIIQNAVDELIDKIDMILQFYKNKNVSNKVKKIYIFGGTSKIKGMERYMSKRFGLETRRIENLDNLTIKKHSMQMREKISDYINAIGSIIRL